MISSRLGDFIGLYFILREVVLIWGARRPTQYADAQRNCYLAGPGTETEHDAEVTKKRAMRCQVSNSRPSSRECVALATGAIRCLLFFRINRNGALETS